MKKRLVTILLIAAIGLFLLFQADIASISLNGYSFLYGDVARQYLNEPPLYVGSRAGGRQEAFCGPQAVQAELKKSPADMICVPLKPGDILHDGCDRFPGARAKQAANLFDQLTLIAKIQQ